MLSAAGRSKPAKRKLCKAGNFETRNSRWIWQKKEEDLKKRKKVFTSEDIQKFYYAYKNDIGQYPVVVLFLLETGMRSGEFSALRNDNIDLNNNKIHIVEAFGRRFKNNDKNNEMEYYTKVPKNKEARYIIMSDLCRECVLYMME